MRDDARLDVFVKFDVAIRLSLFDNEEPHFGCTSEEEHCKDEVFPCTWV
jgi:hypothetical protein